jgi:hypothetical protein
MDLRKTDMESLKRLGEIWKTTPGAEFEAMLTGMELTAWQDVIQYLRSLGMRENPQIVRMNICLPNDIRITLEGAGVIQAYCRDNRIADKPFVAMLKENIQDAEPVTLDSYSARAKLKREIPLAADDERVQDVISRWDRIPKHFRNIQRFEFTAPKGIPLRFDVSIVRENAGRPARTFQEARITTAPPHYEAEVELTASRETTAADAAVVTVIRGLSWLLQGRQRAFVLVTNQQAEHIRDDLGRIFASVLPGGSSKGGRNRNRSGPTPQFRYPGPQPGTLERRNMVAQGEPGVPNLRTLAGGYNVTDKADGLRCMLFVSDIGRIYLVDGGGRVYASGKQVDDKLAGLALDGEWIRRDKTGAPVSHFYAFDIMAGPGGDIGVADLPFMVAGATLGSVEAGKTRLTAIKNLVMALKEAKQMVRGVPATHNLQIGVKNFRSADGDDIFRNCAAVVMEEAAMKPYNTDGLIFTPNAAALPLGKGTWGEQLKWKPAHENTIDFLVIIERERDPKTKKPFGADTIGTKYREDAGQTVRYKTLRLFVGGTKDIAFADPRRTVLTGESLPRSLEEGEWREVEFRPTEPRDPMASVCYVAIGEGSTDPARATSSATALDTDSDLIRCTRTGDVIQSDMIVEMAYHPERAPGWRWEPLRVRHDKTERWLAQQVSGGRKGGTMNADWVANSIWSTLHNPITEEAIRTGNIVQCLAPTTVSASTMVRRAPARDLMKVQCMLNFHNDVIKRNMLLRPVLAPGASVCDLGMGRADDMGRWLAAQVGYVFGCDADAKNVNDPEDGAYRRLLNKMVSLGGRDKIPPMTFAQADMAQRIVTGEAGMTDEDKQLLIQTFGSNSNVMEAEEGEVSRRAFDVVSAMFSLQYMFRDENTLAGFLTNVADLLKVGGYFVGCAPDGDAIARLFAGNDNRVVAGNDGAAYVWMMTSRFSGAVGNVVPPSNAGLGMAVDVDFIGLGETYTQYLVSWPYLQARLAECGLELLTKEELAAVGLPASSQMFGETWAAAEAAGEAYTMSDAVRRLSFMNRWWVFKRRSDRRPAPPTSTPLPPGTLTEVKGPDTTTVKDAQRRVLSTIRETEAEAATTEPKPELVINEANQEEEADINEKIVLPAPVFVINPVRTDDDQRLGPEFADWQRYMGLGTITELTDMNDPSVKYPSIEAALASAKYQFATNLPKEVGPTLFRIEGATHQEFEAERARLRAAGATTEALQKTVNDQVNKTRILSGKNYIQGKRKGTFDAGAWDAKKAQVYQEYLTQRYTKDVRFRDMVNAIAVLGGDIQYANGTEYNEMGVGIREEGGREINVGGDNKIGKWIMSLSS